MPGVEEKKELRDGVYSTQEQTQPKEGPHEQAA